MGLTQSTPETSDNFVPSAAADTREPPRERVAIASGPTPNPLERINSPPHPSRSSLNPSTGYSSRRSAISYFFPISTPDLQHSHLKPTLFDTRQAAIIMSERLPPELVERVLDEAGYWAGCRTLIQKDLTVVAGAPGPRGPPVGWRNGQEEELMSANAEGLRDGREGEVWYLVSEAVGCDESRDSEERNEKEGNGGEEPGGKCWLRAVVLETLSKDQGWSSAVTANPALYGTYDHSYSWFEVSLLRDGREVEGIRRSFQNNVHAGQYFKAHRNVLGPDDPLVRQAKAGDRVVLWVRAQYPGWRSLVREAAITLYNAPFPSQI